MGEDSDDGTCEETGEEVKERERDNEAVKKRIKFEETDEETGKSKLKRQTMGYYHNLEDLTGIE